MGKHERAGAKGRGGRLNLPPHVEAAAPSVSTPEQAHQTREDRLRALGAKPIQHPRAELPIIKGTRIRCPREGCGSIHSVVIKSFDHIELAKERKVQRRCTRCRRDFIVHET